MNLKIETEALLTAAQDQALSTKAHKTYIQKTSTDAKCRLCKDTDETVSHILTACRILAPTEYVRRHNEVAKVIHLNICKAYDIQTPKQYWKHEPLPVTDNEKAKILWDFEIRTDHHISARRPITLALCASVSAGSPTGSNAYIVRHTDTQYGALKTCDEANASSGLRNGRGRS